MHDDGERATQPEELNRLIVERLNAIDVDRLVALYEPDAVLAVSDGQVATGAEQIRKAYERMVAGRPTFAPGAQRPTLRSGDLAPVAARRSAYFSLIGSPRSSERGCTRRRDLITRDKAMRFATDQDVVLRVALRSPVQR